MPLYDNLNYKKVILQHINLDKKPFSFSFPEFDQKLYDSISSIGLINPPTLFPEKNGSRFLIVSGVRRILACKKLGMKILPCLIIEKEKRCNEKLIIFNLKINLSHRELNFVEMANFFNLLKETGIQGETIISKFMPELKLSKSRKIYEDILSIYSLDVNSKMRIIEWGFPLKTSAALSRYSKTERDSMMKLAETLLPGLNRFKEIIMLLEEVALIQKLSIKDIINHYLVDFTKDNALGKKERAEKIRLKLKELKYPKLTKLEKKWVKCVKNLHLPQEIKITAPSLMEGKKMKIEIALSPKVRITDSLQKLNDALKSSSLEELIN